MDLPIHLPKGFLRVELEMEMEAGMVVGMEAETVVEIDRLLEIVEMEMDVAVGMDIVAGVADKICYIALQDHL